MYIFKRRKLHPDDIRLHIFVVPVFNVFEVIPVASHASLRPALHLSALVHGTTLWMLLHHGVLRPQAARHHGVRRTAA